MTDGQDTVETLNWYDLLKEDLPERAYETFEIGDINNKREVTSIKAQYIKDRLNKLFGPFGWLITGSFEEKARDGYIYGVLFKGKLVIGGKGFPSRSSVTSVTNHEIETEGYSHNTGDLGDCYKSARTAALSKAASYLGIGHSVFIGEKDAGKFEFEASQKEKKRHHIQDMQDRWDKALAAFKNDLGLELADVLMILESYGQTGITRSTADETSLDILTKEYSILKGQKFNAESE